MWKYALLCAVLAPGAVVKAAVFAVPEPTFVAAAVDGWSPAPTKAPNLGAIELFRRDEPWKPFESQGTCGFFNGVSSSAYTCRQSNHVCATNSYYGNHGCCDPYEPPESCTLINSCVPKSLMSKSCSDSACLNDDSIAKCTASASPECYEFQFAYTKGARSTVMKEYGCTDVGRTTQIPLLPDGYIISTTTSTSTSSSSTDGPSPSETPQQATKGDSKPNNIPAIIGGVIGGLALLSALIFAIVFLLLRERRRKHNTLSQHQQQHQDWPSPSPGTLTPGMSEITYNPEGFVGCNVYGEEPRSTVTEDPGSVGKNWKAWGAVNRDRDKKGRREEVTSCDVEGMYGAVEVGGRMVCEAPA